MQDSANVNIPKPPDTANIDEMHKHMLSLYTFLQQNFGAGTQSTFFSQNQLNQMVSNNDLKQAGKIFMNSDTGKINAAIVTGGVLAMQVL